MNKNLEVLQNSSINPQETITAIPRELDLKDWNLEFGKKDIQVFTRPNAASSDVIGFKTVTYHAIKLENVLTLLKDVCDAMNSINDMFLKGEVFRKWPTEFDADGSLVRTSFKMPFPFKNREFLHGLHYMEVDKNTHVIAYTPVEVSEIPIQENYIRCRMYHSGQRVMQLENGLVQVEHLMVYKLGGRISKYIQDKWLKPSHVNAYVKEWRNLRAFLFPPKNKDLNYIDLKNIGQNAFAESGQWIGKGRGKNGIVKVGRLRYTPHNAFRLDLEVNMDIETVSKVLADQSLEYLPRWNREFKIGEVLQKIEESDKMTTWYLKVQYRTPNPLDDREYTYYFAREWISKDEVLITYCSIDYTDGPPEGVTRALLYPSFHRCIRVSGRITKIEHILATDLQGRLGKYQDNILGSSLIKAQYSDMEKQVALFKAL